MRISRTLWVSLGFLGFILVGFGSNSRGQDVPRLSKDDGPYLVLAYSFRGPDSEALAKILTMELRKEYDLPASLYQPPGGKSPDYQVFVGDCKTTREAFDLKNRVKKLHSRMDAQTPWRKATSLSRASVADNPLFEPK
jgi:hypothetical protein